MRDGCIEPFAVNNQMPIRSDLDTLATQPHQSFDVKLVSWDVPRVAVFLRDSFGFENDDLAAFRRPKIVSQPVYKKMISGAYFEFNNVLSLTEMLARLEPSATSQALRRSAEIWRKPDGIRLSAQNEALLNVKNKQS